MVIVCACDVMKLGLLQSLPPLQDTNHGQNGNIVKTNRSIENIRTTPDFPTTNNSMARARKYTYHLYGVFVHE